MIAAEIYLDANATTRPLSSIITAMTGVMSDGYGNASSAHERGQIARSHIEKARDGVCSLVGGADPEGVIFTSGGTEANNTVLRSDPSRHLVTTAVEHPSVLRVAEAMPATICPVGASGVADPTEIARAVSEAPGAVLVSVQWANSETGVVQPIAEIVAAVRGAVRDDVLIHIDAAQAVGRVPIDLRLGIDALTLSGHKLHAPQGIGAVVLADPEDRRIRPFLLGGGQERGLRSGTENVPGAVGLGLAMDLRAQTFDLVTVDLRRMRDLFEQEILAELDGVAINGAAAPRVGNTSNLRFPGTDGMALVARLDAEGLFCSQGSACSSGKPEPSHTLTAMGFSESDAYASVRFSFSVLNTVDEARRAARLVIETVKGG